MEDDVQLLRAYADNRSEDAFRALVERHGPMVQGVARRIAGEDHAEEVTQAVFVILARKASTLGSAIVAGWLYRTARYVALESVREQKRQRQLQEKCLAMQTDPAAEDSIWTQIAPLLDAALHRLRAADREAIILRFLQGRTFAEVASATGATEAAAKMRVNRALEKLRAHLVRDGVTVTSAALATELSTHAVTATSPAIATLALAKATDSAIPTLAQIALKMILMKKLKIAAAVAVALLLTIAITAPSVLRPSAVVTTFSPMDGEWTGTMEVTTRGNKTTNPVELAIKTSPDGRRCNIEMRISQDGDISSWSFAHEIDPTGRQIATTDDPRINLLNGFGDVTESKQNGAVWTAAVRAKHPRGVSECRWTVRDGQLRITREDQTGPFLHRTTQYSALDLRRKVKVASNP